MEWTTLLTSKPEDRHAANYRHLSVPGGVAQAWYVLSERRFLQADFDLCFIHQRFYALLNV